MFLDLYGVRMYHWQISISEFATDKDMDMDTGWLTSDSHSDMDMVMEYTRIRTEIPARTRTDTQTDRIGRNFLADPIPHTPHQIYYLGRD